MRGLTRLIFVSVAVFFALPAVSRAAEISLDLNTGAAGQKVFFVSELTSWEKRPLAMTEVQAGRYSISFESPWLHGFKYKFIIDGGWTHDPANPDKVPDGNGGFNSVKRVDFAEDPWLEPLAGAEPMRRDWLVLRDYEGDQRIVPVVSPARPDYGRRQVGVYFQDGGDYLEFTGAVQLLSNLSAVKTLPQFTGVFIPPKDRMREYAMDDKYAAFTARTVVGAVEQRFRCGGEPRDRALIGPSMGGLITVYTAIKHKDVFGNAGSQSGAFWKDEAKLLGAIQSVDGHGLRMFIEFGLFEGPHYLESNQRATAALRSVGVDTRYRVYPSTHDWIAWRNRLQEILRFFWGAA